MKDFKDMNEEEKKMMARTIQEEKDKMAKRTERCRNMEILVKECYGLSKTILGLSQKLADFQKKFDEVIDKLDNPKDIKLYYELSKPPVRPNPNVTEVSCDDPMFKNKLMRC